VGVTVGVALGVTVGVGVGTTLGVPEPPPQPIDSMQTRIRAPNNSRLISPSCRDRCRRSPASR